MGWRWMQILYPFLRRGLSAKSFKEMGGLPK